MKKILLVDDNPQELEMMARILGDRSRDEWQIFTAQNTGRAMLILQQHAIDLAVVDVQMPVVDGIQFLALLNRNHPRVRKVSLTGYADDAARTACLEQGAELFLEKPRSSEDLDKLFVTLRDLARQQPGHGGKLLSEISLSDVLRMECLNQSSAVMEINAGTWHGHIYLKDGVILHAQTGDLDGEAALKAILALKSVDFNLAPFNEPVWHSIHTPWEALLSQPAASPFGVPPSGGRSPESQDASSAYAANNLSLPSPLNGERAGVRGGNANDVAIDTPPDGSPRIEEMVVFSGDSLVLYENQCANTNDRIAFLEFVAKQSLQIAEGLNLGEFDRLEMEDGPLRIIAQSKSDRALFVRINRGLPSAPVTKENPANKPAITSAPPNPLTILSLP